MSDREEWLVQIIDRETGEVIHAIVAGDYLRAERVARGVNINLDHKRYKTDLAIRIKGSRA